MIKAMRTAASGMIGQQMNVDNIANNLANVNTTGFKQDRAAFTDLLYQEIQRAGVRLPNGNVTPVGKSIGSGVRLAAIDKEFRQGSLRQTGNPFDMAIQGEGFFQVTLQNGNLAYTRDGSFKRDAQGNIVNSAGLMLQPQISLGAEVITIAVTPDGLLQGYDGVNPQPVTTVQIELARFVNPKGLRAIGGNLYVETEASGTAETGNPGTAQFGTLQGGFLEESNVEIVREMVELISAQRAYEINSNAIKTADEMLRVANNLRA